MGYGVIYNKKKYDLDERLYNICLAELSNESRQTYLKLQRHLPGHLRILSSISCPVPHYTHITPDDMNYMSKIIWKNKDVNEYIHQQIYTEDNVLGKIKAAMNEEYASKKGELVDDIISVGEFKTIS